MSTPPTTPSPTSPGTPSGDPVPGRPYPTPAQQKDHGRAGRNLPAAVASAVLLLGMQKRSA